MAIADDAVDEVLEMISFEIAGQEFCVDVKGVREIRGWTPATPIPHAPDYVMGVINLRGAVMPVLDLRRRLELGKTEPTSRHVIVVGRHGDRQAGLLVDGVQETFRAEASQLQPPPDIGLHTERMVDAILPLKDRLLSRLVLPALFPAA